MKSIMCEYILHQSKFLFALSRRGSWLWAGRNNDLCLHIEDCYRTCL